jgi:hypothetical protein
VAFLRDAVDGKLRLNRRLNVAEPALHVICTEQHFIDGQNNDIKEQKIKVTVN